MTQLLKVSICKSVVRKGSRPHSRNLNVILISLLYTCLLLFLFFIFHSYFTLLTSTSRGAQVLQTSFFQLNLTTLFCVSSVLEKLVTKICLLIFCNDYLLFSRLSLLHKGRCTCRIIMPKCTCMYAYAWLLKQWTVFIKLCMIIKPTVYLLAL